MASAETKVGVLGAGRGMVFAEAFDVLPESRTVAIADRVASRRDHAKRICPNARIYAEYAEMLQHHDLDAVVVASEGPAHSEHVVQALQAGKHVLSEVPIAYTIEGHVAIFDAVQSSGREYMLAENCVHWGFVRAWKHMHQTGQLGEISYGESEYLHDIRDAHFVDDNGRHHKHPDGAIDTGLRRTWWARMHPIQYITHSLGPLLWVTGDRCQSVSCMATPANRDPLCGSPDVESALFRTEAGRVFRVIVGFNAVHPPGHRYALMGSKGTVICEDSNVDNPKMLLDDQEMQGWCTMSWETLTLQALASGQYGPNLRLAWEFLDAVVHGTEPTIGLHRAMDIGLPGLCAALSAERGGEVMRIPDTRDEGALSRFHTDNTQEPWPFGSKERTGW